MSDLIYKQQAIDAIYNTFSYAYCNNCENNGKDNYSCDECHRKYQNWAASRNTIESVINALPPAEPRKKGKWIQPCDITGFGRCSSCNALWNNSLIENRYFRYCPRCGADMRGEQNEHTSK